MLRQSETSDTSERERAKEKGVICSVIEVEGERERQKDAYTFVHSIHLSSALFILFLLNVLVIVVRREIERRW